MMIKQTCSTDPIKRIEIEGVPRGSIVRLHANIEHTEDVEGNECWTADEVMLKDLAGYSETAIDADFDALWAI